MEPKLVDMPLGIKGLSVFDDLGTQIIYLNSRYNYETNVKSYEHEVSHKDDAQSDIPAGQLEYLRHQR
jgi:hypothetical protein